MPLLKKIFVLFLTIILSSIFLSYAQEKGRIYPALTGSNARDSLCTFYKWFDPNTTDKEGKLLLKNCSSCHMAYYKEWKSDKHSMSQNNPFFLAIYKDFNRDHPDQNGNCTLCHNPEIERIGETANRRDGEKNNFQRATKTNGISCDFCHKIESVDQDPLKKGIAGLNILRPCKGMKDIRFGPIKDPIPIERIGESAAFSEPRQGRGNRRIVEYEELKYNSLYKTSLYCAKCHDGSNGNVQIYSTFTEWVNSPASKRGVQCQSCHMAPRKDAHEIVDNPDIKHRIRPYYQIHSHSFLTEDPHEFRKKYVDLKIKTRIGETANRPAPPAKRGERTGEKNNLIIIEAIVSNNNFGHSFPTGSPMRNAILVLDVKYINSKGEVTSPQQIKGPRLPNYAGDLKGKPGKLFAKILAETSGEYAVKHGDKGIKFRKIMDKLGIPAQDWWNVFIQSDTRIKANENDVSVYEFTVETHGHASLRAQITAKLIWRNTWPGLAKVKGIKLKEDLLLEEQVNL